MPHVPRSLAAFARLESETLKGHAGSDLSRSHVSRHVRPHVAAHMSLRLRGRLSSSVRVFVYVGDRKRAEITSERRFFLNSSALIQALVGAGQDGDALTGHILEKSILKHPRPLALSTLQPTVVVGLGARLEPARGNACVKVCIRFYT